MTHNRVGDPGPRFDHDVFPNQSTHDRRSGVDRCTLKTTALVSDQGHDGIKIVLGTTNLSPMSADHHSPQASSLAGRLPKFPSNAPGPSLEAIESRPRHEHHTGVEERRLTRTGLARGEDFGDPTVVIEQYARPTIRGEVWQESEGDQVSGGAVVDEKRVEVEIEHTVPIDDQD